MENRGTACEDELSHKLGNVVLAWFSLFVECGSAVHDKCAHQRDCLRRIFGGVFPRHERRPSHLCI